MADEKSREAFRKWYARHKRELSDKRKRRYQSDPTYRDKCQSAARDRKRKLAEKIPEGRVWRKLHGKWTLAIKVSKVAELCHTDVHIIRGMEKKELIPPSIFQERTRAYTQFQLQLIREVLSMVGTADMGRVEKAKGDAYKNWTRNIEYKD